MPKTVENLNMEKIKKTIKWSAKVRLHQLNEDDDSLIGETEWPKGSGDVYYVCATSGLLFKKQSGECLQSPHVQLKLETMEPSSPKAFAKFMSGRKKRDFGRSSRHLICEA